MPNHWPHPTRRLAPLLLAAVVLLFNAAQTAHSQTVEAYIVVDDYTKKILAEHNGNQKRQVASLTKIATAMVVLDWAEASKTDLNNFAIVPRSAATLNGKLGLMPGDRISLRNCLYASLLTSDNVAAETLAAYVGGDLLRREGRGGDPVEHFVSQMNLLAGKLGMLRTKFTNPHGLDHLGGTKPFSTAADMARLSLYAVGKGSFMFYVAQKERDVSYFRGEEEKHYRLGTSNNLLGKDNIDGLKTGLTRAAGPCLALTSAQSNLVTERPDGASIVTPRRLVIIVLGAEDRYGAAHGLLMRGRAQFEAWRAAGRIVKAREELLTHF